MRRLKRLSSILALMLTLSMVLSACQVPEGVEVPSGVSIPSDLSDFTSEELEQLESYLEDAEASVDAEDAQTQVVVKGTVDLPSGRDRLLYSVLGADFVTNSGFDFKTATMDDYKVAGANCLINRTGTKCNTAYGPQVYAQAYRDLGNERLYEFCVRNLVGLAKEDVDVDTALYIDNIKIYQ